MDTWKTLGTRHCYSDAWVRLRVDDVVRPDGSVGTYSVLELKGGIGVVAVDGMGQLLLVGQHRYPIQAYSWEIPKGAFDSFDGANSPLDTAQRELREETGFVGGRWSKLGTVHTLLGSTNDLVHLFRAHELVPGSPHPDSMEDLTVCWVSRAQFWKMVADGRITDATSIAAVSIEERHAE